MKTLLLSLAALAMTAAPLAAQTEVGISNGIVFNGFQLNGLTMNGYMMNGVESSNHDFYQLDQQPLGQ